MIDRISRFPSKVTTGVVLKFTAARYGSLTHYKEGLENYYDKFDSDHIESKTFVDEVVEKNLF